MVWINLLESTGGWSYAPKTAVAGNGTYAITALDKAGNQTTVNITIDNSIKVTVDEIDGSNGNPNNKWFSYLSADNTPADNVPVKVTINGTEYDTVTDANGKWSVAVSPALLMIRIHLLSMRVLVTSQ